MPAKDKLKQDILGSGVALEDPEWQRLSKDCIECSYATGDVIFSCARITDHWLFLTSGIAASEQTTRGGDSLIARFFEPGQICSNLTSAWSREIASDELVAITNVEGVLIPDALFRKEFLKGQSFGEYIRIKCMETLLFDKDIICAKTSNNTEVRYQLLERHYVDVVQRVKQKDLARFMGLTPQGLNRFLQRRRK